MGDMDVDLNEIVGKYAQSLGMCVVEQEKLVEECLEEADALVGESDFPALCREVAQVGKRVGEEDRDLRRVFFRRAFVFFADRGRGYNAALKILYKLLCATDLFMTENGKERIMSLKYHATNELKPLKEGWFDKANQENLILSIDLSDLAGSLDGPQMQDYLIWLRDRTKDVENVVIFRLPYMEKDQARAAIRMINWFFTTRLVFFQPLTDEDALEMADIFFDTMGCQMEPDAREAFLELVRDTQENGYFYGSHTLRKLVDDVIAQRLVSERYAESWIQKADIMACSRYREINRTQEGQLTLEQVFAPMDNMVGMEEISREVRGIVRSILYTRKTGQAAPSLHMVLTGNPGTGKTTVARVIAAALKYSGVLSVGKCVECTAADLIAQYVGQSAPQTRAVCRSAYGSVLFIDEAYTMASRRAGNTFGEEALAELISQMENHREDFVVIMAGYADDMEEMLRVNAGMKRRLAYRIDIPFCNGEQLRAIFMQQLRGRKKQTEKSGYALDWDTDLEQAVGDFFASIPEQVLSDKAFGNGGYARNLLEKTINNAVTRCSQNRLDDLVYDLVLNAGDFEQATKQVKMI